MLDEGEVRHTSPGPPLPQASVHTQHSFSDIRLFPPVPFCFQSGSRHLLSACWLIDPEPMKAINGHVR